MRTNTNDDKTKVAVAVAIPVLWLPLALLHPFGLEDLIEHGQSGRWLLVHASQLVLTAPLGLVMLWLLSGSPGTATTVARTATVLWVGSFSAFETIAGVATGVLAKAGHAEATRGLFENGLVGGELSVLSVVAHPLWGAVAIATALSLRDRPEMRSARAALYLSLPFAVSHVGPLAAIALGFLAYAIRALAHDRLRGRPAQIQPSQPTDLVASNR